MLPNFIGKVKELIGKTLVKLVSQYACTFINKCIMQEMALNIIQKINKFIP